MNGIGGWTRDGILWAAGHFDGEGCLHGRITKEDNARACGSHKTWSLRVVSTDRDVLERYLTVFGIGKIYGPRIDSRKKPLYAWQTRSPAAIYAICVAMLPFMGERRTAAFMEFLKYYKDYRYNGGVRRPLSAETRAKISATLKGKRTT